MLFFDRLFPTRSTSSIHGLVDRVFRPQFTSLIHAVVILITAIGLVITSTAFAASWETSAMRAPGGGLVRIGMTRLEVLKELGEPQRTRVSTHNTAASGKSGKKGGSLTYRGEDGLYNIMFSNERVVRIVVTPKRD
jgi:hypothetical protein